MAPRTKRKTKAQREDNELERLQEENRQLKATVRSLSKTVKKLSKGSHRLEDLEEMLQDEYDNKKEPAQDTANRKSCPDCGGATEEIPLGPKSLEVCTDPKFCGWRRKPEKAKKASGS